MKRTMTEFEAEFLADRLESDRKKLNHLPKWKPSHPEPEPVRESHIRPAIRSEVIAERLVGIMRGQKAEDIKQAIALAVKWRGIESESQDSRIPRAIQVVEAINLSDDRYAWADGACNLKRDIIKLLGSLEK